MTGMTVYGNDAVGRRRQESSEKIWYGRGRAGGRGVLGWWGGGEGADVPCLLSSLVRAQV